MTHFGFDVEQRYLDAVRGLWVRSDGDRSLSIVYTPMHGAGDRLARRALAEAGFTDVTTVPEQAEPDGAFPTVAFPNPEEKGAMDLAFALARSPRRGPDHRQRSRRRSPRRRGAPRRGRLRAAHRQPGGRPARALPAHRGGARARAAGGARFARVVAELGVIARALGVHYEETLTGFKWIANRAMELERETGARFVFGFEEALGYTVGSVVRDKDGISAAVIAAELAAVLRAQGKTLLDELETLARRYGLFASGQRSLTLPGSDGAARIGAMMARLRAAPPARLGAWAVLSVGDYQARRRTAADGTVTPIALPESNVLTFDLEGGSRVIARPSGTEPKIKFYLDLREPVARGEAFAAAEQRAADRMAELAAAFLATAGVS